MQEQLGPCCIYSGTSYVRVIMHGTLGGDPAGGNSKMGTCRVPSSSVAAPSVPVGHCDVG